MSEQSFALATGVTARALLPAGGPIGLYRLSFAPDAELATHAHPQHECWHVLAGDGVLLHEGRELVLVPGGSHQAAGGEPHSLQAGPYGLELLAIASPDWACDAAR